MSTPNPPQPGSNPGYPAGGGPTGTIPPGQPPNPYGPPPQRPCPRQPGAPEVITRWLPGVIVVALGVGFLLSNLHVWHWRLRLDCLWPVILIIVGLGKITWGGFSDAVWGLAIAAFGGGVMLSCFGYLPFDWWNLWPIFVVALGVIWLWSANQKHYEGGPQIHGPWPGDWAARQRAKAEWRARRRDWRTKRHDWLWTNTSSQPWWAAPGGEPPSVTAARAAWAAPPADPTAPSAPAGESPAGAASPAPAAALGDGSWVHLSAVFSGLRRRISSPQFRGATCFAFFGGCDLDLRPLTGTTLDHPIVLDLHAIFGGVEIWVPPNWRVSVEGVGIFGGFEDQSRPPLDETAAAGHLVVRGEAVFGGVVVK